MTLFRSKSKDDNVDDLQPQSGAGGGVTTIVDGRDDAESVQADSLAPSSSSNPAGSNPSTNGSAAGRQSLRLGDQLLLPVRDRKEPILQLPYVPRTQPTIRCE